MEFNSLPTGPRLGKIRGDLDQATILLEAMALALGDDSGEGAVHPDDASFVEGCLGVAAAYVREAIENVDHVLKAINDTARAGADDQ